MPDMVSRVAAPATRTHSSSMDANAPGRLARVLACMMCVAAVAVPAAAAPARVAGAPSAPAEAPAPGSPAAPAAPNAPSAPGAPAEPPSPDSGMEDHGVAPDEEQVLPSPSLSPQPVAPAASRAPAPSGASAPADDDPRALQQFKPQLDPYGTWVDDPKYGRIWVPDRAVVGQSFSPYVTGGHWALDADENWVWVSDYPFGEITFHYGRWVWTSYGWSWIPGYRYAPSWVVWRVPTGHYEYVGWAPAAPGFIWMGGVAVSVYYPLPFYWVFCPSAYLFAPYPYYYAVTNPAYVQTLGHYTRHYVPASPALVTHGPPLAVAHVPAQAVPATRLPVSRGGPAMMTRPGVAPNTSAPHSFGQSPRSPGGASRPSAPTAFSPTARTPAPPSRVGAPRMVTPPGAAPRALSPPSLVAPPGAYSPPSSRAFSPPTRMYSPPGAYSPARGYSPPSSPPPGAYSPAHGYSPGHGGSPAPRVYSPPSTYSPARTYSPPPRVYSPPSRVYSPPAWHPSPSFHPSGSPGPAGGHHR
jgi:hypothetical protein